MAPAAVDAADLGLRAGERETLEIWPETQETVWTEGESSIFLSTVPFNGQRWHPKLFKLFDFMLLFAFYVSLCVVYSYSYYVVGYERPRKTQSLTMRRGSPLCGLHGLKKHFVKPFVSLQMIAFGVCLRFTASLLGLLA